MVDFPQPDGPSSDRNDPLVVPRLVASSAFTDLRPRVKVLLSPWMLSPVAALGSLAGSVVACEAPAPAAADVTGTSGRVSVDISSASRVRVGSSRLSP